MNSRTCQWLSRPLWPLLKVQWALEELEISSSCQCPVCFLSASCCDVTQLYDSLTYEGTFIASNGSLYLLINSSTKERPMVVNVNKINWKGERGYIWQAFVIFVHTKWGYLTGSLNTYIIYLYRHLSRFQPPAESASVTPC